MKAAFFNIALQFSAKQILGFQSNPANGIIQQSIEVLGGEENIKSMKLIVREGIGHEYSIEQSERPEGPLIPKYFQFKEILDPRNNRLVKDISTKGSQSPDWFTV